MAEIPGSDGIPKSIRESWNSKLFESQAHIGRGIYLPISIIKRINDYFLDKSFCLSYLIKQIKNNSLLAYR